MLSVDTTAMATKRRLVFSRTNFVDYWIGINSIIRKNDTCDSIVSGAIKHPVLAFAHTNAQHIQDYNIIAPTPDQWHRSRSCQVPVHAATPPQPRTCFARCASGRRVRVRARAGRAWRLASPPDDLLSRVCE